MDSSEAAHFEYVGRELETFRLALRWKSYWTSRIEEFLQGDVLEVGAGLGSNTPFLVNRRVTSWLCLEPDTRLAAQLHRAIERIPHCSAAVGTIRAVSGQRFDAILYADVVEHLQDDREELSTAAALLRPGGRLIVLSPAHQNLFSRFDQSIGHLRRYSRASLAGRGPAGCSLTQLFFLDCMGIPVLMANKVFARRSLPTPAQIRFWDSVLVPVSRLLDPLTGYRLGKTIVGIWTRES
jgi:SAM-dependent methyltransferase